MARHRNNTRYAMMMEVAERRILEWELAECGSVSATADSLGITTRHLYRLLKRHGIETPRGGYKQRSDAKALKSKRPKDAKNGESHGEFDSGG